VTKRRNLSMIRSMVAPYAPSFVIAPFIRLSA
jgi:hypothetical protein